MGLLKAIVLSLLFWLGSGHEEQAKACDPTVTTASGTKAPAIICAGDLIFDDEFDEFDLSTWDTRNYKSRRRYVLITRIGVVKELAHQPTNFLSSIFSARIRTDLSFNFKYGKLEIRAKLPAGDWLWPAIWMLPRYNSYSSWPASGEVDIVESRGNLNLVQNGVNIGSEQVSSTLHFGPYWPLNSYMNAHFAKNTDPGNGFDKDFQRFQMEWTQDHMKFSIDDVEVGTVTPPDGGFWELGGFQSQNPNAENPWRSATKMAPFDQEFYIVMNLAVGGINNFFPDDAENPGGKPWKNNEGAASTDFWNARSQWMPTWNMNGNLGGDSASLQVDYVKVWSL